MNYQSEYHSKAFKSFHGCDTLIQEQKRTPKVEAPRSTGGSAGSSDL